jgi:hypothetical protein
MIVLVDWTFIEFGWLVHSFLLGQKLECSEPMVKKLFGLIEISIVYAYHTQLGEVQGHSEPHKADLCGTFVLIVIHVCPR